jgi:putative aldouronate transport system substrate-binding protein
MDWLAVPFGSQEDLLLHYGIDGQDFAWDDKGVNPIPNQAGLMNAGYVPWQYLAQRPYVQYQSDLPNYASISFEVEQKLVNVSVLDPRCSTTPGRSTPRRASRRRRPSRTRSTRSFSATAR